jgi:hypothetical protein
MIPARYLLMAFLPALGFVAAPAASPAPRTPSMRLSGLDRLYFTQTGGAERLAAPPAVAALLPRALAARRVLPLSEEPGADELTLTDFPLPLPAWPRRVLLRQVVDSRHPRITELWVALYDGGERSDVRHFQALPKLTDNKQLPNYWIDGTEAGPEGTVLVRLRGTMFRPQGAWWAAGKVVTLAAARGVLAYAHVRNAFGFIKDYDRRGDASDPPPALSASAEREAGGRLERRDLSPVPLEVLKSCGAASSDEIGETWDEMEKIAESVTRAPGSTASSRAAEEPSFAERGYKEP